MTQPNAHRAPAPHDSNPAFGVYIHWPFCASKCPYCDFNSHVRERIDNKAWCAALCAEIEEAEATLWQAHKYKNTEGNKDGSGLASIFFGGGTPSLMELECVAEVIDKVRSLWGNQQKQEGTQEDIEITLECNPSDLDRERCRGLREAGVNRLSIGVQSFDDETLRFLGRRHNAAQAQQAVRAAVESGVRVSMDLMYAHPAQTRALWRADLETALGYETEHISAYQLTLEPNTPFYAQARRGELSLPSEERALALFRETEEQLGRAGLVRYETSNYARGGRARGARHNLAIWYGGDYAAIGAGAHGRASKRTDTRADTRANTGANTNGIERIAVERVASPERWLRERLAGASTWREVRTLTDEQVRDEMFLSGLRLADGISYARLKRETGCADFRTALPEARRLDDLIEAGFLELDESGLRTSGRGVVRLDGILTHLLATAPAFSPPSTTAPALSPTPLSPTPLSTPA